MLVAEPVAKADAEYVRQRTGYAIGVYHLSDMWSRWCAWSTRTCCSTSRFGLRPGRRAVFRLTPADLQRITDGRVVSVAARRLT